MKIIVFNYVYYFQTMAQKVSKITEKEVSEMFDRLREVEKQKILNSGLTPDQQEAVIDEVIAIFKYRLKKQDVMQKGSLYNFENDCINTIKSLDEWLIIDRVVRNSR